MMWARRLSARSTCATAMMRREPTAFLYAVSSPILKINGILYRRFRAPRTGIVKVQLGPGQRNYLPDWINLDANILTAKIDVWVDLRNPLPFHDSTVSAIYSHHVVEHLPDLFFHFREIYRTLKPGGIFRVGGPNGDAAIRKFVDADRAWFGDFPDVRSSLGGRLDNFIFCRREHLMILTESFLDEAARAAGFPRVIVCEPTKTGYPDLIDGSVLALEAESTPDCPHTLIVEGQKPV